MPALNRIQVAQGERGVVVAPDERGVFLARSLKQQCNVGQNCKSAIYKHWGMFGTINVIAWGSTADTALFALNRIKMRNKNAAFDSSLILNGWSIKWRFSRQRVNYTASFHCILFIAMGWITPPCCASHLSGLAFILAEQSPLCNIFVPITRFLTAKPHYQAGILRQPT